MSRDGDSSIFHTKPGFGHYSYTLLRVRHMGMRHVGAFARYIPGCEDQCVQGLVVYMRDIVCLCY